MNQAVETAAFQVVRLQASLSLSPPLRVFVVGMIRTSGIVIDPFATSPKESVVSLSWCQLLELDWPVTAPPAIVVSLLASMPYDATDIAEYLDQHSFRGCYAIYSREAPNPAMIRAELARAYPLLDIRLLGDRDLVDHA